MNIIAQVVYLDPEGMELAWAKAQQMKEKESFYMKKASQLVSELREAYTSISEETKYFGHNIVADTVKEKLNAQMAALEEIADDLTAAMEKANQGNSNLKTECEQIGLQLAAIGSIAADFDPSAESASMTATKAMATSTALSGVMGATSGPLWTGLEQYTNRLLYKMDKVIRKTVYEIGKKINTVVQALDEAVKTDKELLAEMEVRYQKLREERGYSFNGACGAFTFRQLKDQGIVEDGEGVKLGKDYYKVWTQRGVTSTGYKVESYSANQGGLDALISAHPDEFIKNVAVSFNYDGKNYTSSAGHVLLITEIRNGQVFFSESAAGKLYNLDGRKYEEGEPLVLSTSDFKKQYPGINGVVHFYQ